MPVLNRRTFLAKAAQSGFASVAAISIPSIVAAATEDQKQVKLEQDAVILFQGDSITDFGRDRKPPKFNTANADRQSPYNDYNALGCGYALLSAVDLLYKHPEKKFRIFNRGISGDKVYQLAERWQADCLDLKPSVVSILIGVNDFWHTLLNGYKGTAETYKTDLRNLLTRTKESLPGVRFIIGEPFALKGVQAVDEKWYPAFDEYRKIAKELSVEFNGAFIPYQRIFDEAVKRAPASYWTFDGVHPSIPGSMLMTEAWLRTVKA